MARGTARAILGAKNVYSDIKVTVFHLQGHANLEESSSLLKNLLGVSPVTALKSKSKGKQFPVLKGLSHQIVVCLFLHVPIN